jgi:RNA polymerase sigma-70 factor, ECF subfamily
MDLAQTFDNTWFPIRREAGRAPFRVTPGRSTLAGMQRSAMASSDDETALARAAAAGDGNAFATLYERYEKRAYNLALRVTGSSEDAADAVQDAFLNVMRRMPDMGDRELAFGSYLFTAARNASYDLMAKRRRAEPSDHIPETAVPVGSGPGGGFGFDPGDPHDDPERGVLLDAQQEEIREANGRLPERQREVLALYELEDMSYDDIAEIMDMNRNSVAQLISRARIRLRDELRGTALASIATASADCERALPLLAMSDDGQLDEDSGDGRWLAGHVAGCETCALSRDAMQEAGVSYRLWVPVGASPLLFRETMAHAAELTGSDWTDVIEKRARARENGAGGSAAGGAAGSPGAALAQRLRPTRVKAGVAALLAAVLVIVGFEAATTDTQPTATVAPTAEELPATPLVKATHKKHRKAKNAAKGGAADGGTPASPQDTTDPSSSPASGDTSPNTVEGHQRALRRNAIKRGDSEGRSGGGGVTPTGDPDPTPQADPPPVVVDPPPVVTDPPPTRTDPPTTNCPPTRPRC